jgi:hypothetical protein
VAIEDVRELQPSGEFGTLDQNASHGLTDRAEAEQRDAQRTRRWLAGLASRPGRLSIDDDA